ncbi:cell wall-binding repeat-containing protein [Clostridioides difficile]|uniref:cell wall-binding repeat-containing protein n=1 Tax=Clostridioides difficile TaxID=1496 RepID=UPI00038DA0BB|nr:cell wall-binding repeat-containing protein [Clostridioides difficile]EQF29824.1 cell wall binding repeat 2 family protein [Clostridioides difficile CD160]MDI2882378.1 cell wall-binding repeat-containing protein [Clostridioides difficile]MDI3004241.1 cell wall-binding repeat-containing protein [Clostridioides difficile]HBG7285412.1 cell wall-binding repeat-containing protein [Clostridioides difficile]
MKINKKLLALGMSVMIFTVSSSNAFALSSIDKIQGQDEYETAALIADKQNYSTAIIINTDRTLADGLSASGLAGVENAPILLVKKDNIPSYTLKRLDKVKKVYIVGGKNSVNESVEKILVDKNIEIHRISGNDRIDTSYNVARVVNSKTKIEKVMLTNAFKGEADAMSISQVAVREKSPIILTDGKTIPFDIKGIKSFVIGGYTSMSNKLVEKTNSTRLGGIDRYETNTKVIKYFYKDPKEFYIASGAHLIYSLVGSTIAKSNPIVLVGKGSDKAILKGAAKVTALGKVYDKDIEEAINAVNGKANKPDSNKEVVDVPGFGPQNPTDSKGEEGNSNGDADKVIGDM